jgi:NADH-quinone oxidoreductase subunit G
MGMLLSPNSTLEEMGLAAALMRGIGSENIDFRLRQSDFSLDPARAGVPWLGHAIEEIDSLDAMLIVGSFLRKDHPLLSARVRAAAKGGAKVISLHALAEDWLMPMAGRITVAPGRWLAALAEVLVACAREANQAVPDVYAGVEPSAHATAAARHLVAAQKAVIWLGNAAVQHPAYGEIARVAQAIAQLTGATVGVIGEAANSVGGHLVGALPASGGNGLNARAMLAQPRKAYLLMGLEPSLDCGDPVAARSALSAAQTVIALTPYRSQELLELADCLLPVTPFAETGGSFVNCEGRLQSFYGAARPQGAARPGWKVLRVLGTVFGVQGFDFDNVEEVRNQLLAAFASDDAEANGGANGQGAQSAPSAPPKVAKVAKGDGRRFQSRLSNLAGGNALAPPVHASPPLQRLADVPIYWTDPLVRRAPSLQLTSDARPPVATMAQSTLEALGIADGDPVVVTQSGGEARLPARRDDRLAHGVVLVPAAHPLTAELPSMFGPVMVARDPDAELAAEADEGVLLS